MKIQESCRAMVTICMLVAAASLNIIGAHSETRQGPGEFPEWTAFRSKFPNHIQGVALSEPRSDGSRIMIVAEPPPHVTVGSLRSVASDAFADPVIMTHRIGHDGWVKDVVIRLSPRTQDELAELCTAVNRHLFGTTYKAYILKIPDAPVTGANAIELGKYKLDFQISAAELHNWLFADDELFYAVDGGPAARLPNLLEKASAGVYFSKARGLVVWLIPQGGDVSDFKVEARQFALDSDCVLGALASAKFIAVLGRERTIPVTVMQPLRAETIVQLASAGTYELAQSYERNNGFAGKFAKGKDWAPIFLSPQLIDTEYGSLLNITDQLLKSWSNNGSTQYEGFIYQRPASWPFDAPLPRLLGVSSLVYNWNTKGAGYAMEADQYALLALYRTGALPVSYIPDDGPGTIYSKKAEDIAYAYFSELGDPSLARVVQYAFLYQTFTNLGLDTTYESRNLPSKTSRVLEEEGYAILDRLRKADSADIEKMANQVMGSDTLGSMPGIQSEATEHEDSKELKIENEAELELQRVTFGYAVRLSLEQLRSILVRAYQIGGEGELRAITSGIVSGKLNKEDVALRILLPDFDLENLRYSLIGSQVLLPIIFYLEDLDQRLTALQALLPGLVDIEELQRRLIKASEATPDTWIHTPAIVISRNKGDMSGCTGGHNLSARVSLFRASEDVPIGRLKPVTEDGVTTILCNPQDVDKVSLVVRDVGRNSETLDDAIPVIEGQLKSAQAPPIRDQRVALDFPAVDLAPMERGLQHVNTGGVSAVRTGWEGRLANELDIARMKAYNSRSTTAVIECRRSDEGLFYITYQAPTSAEPQVYHAFTHSDVVDVVGQIFRRHPPGSANIEFYARGFENEEADGLLRSLEFDAEANRNPVLKVCASEHVDTSRLAEAIQTKYDFRAAKIRREVQVKEARGGSEVTLRIDVPAAEVGKPPLPVRVKLWFEGVFGPELVARIQAKISQLLEAFSGQTLLADFNVEIRKSLNAFISDEKLKGKVWIELEVEKTDVQVSERTPMSHRNECAIERYAG